MVSWWSVDRTSKTSSFQSRSFENEERSPVVFGFTTVQPHITKTQRKISALREKEA
jgi:hypothetical protein